MTRKLTLDISISVNFLTPYSPAYWWGMHSCWGWAEHCCCWCCCCCCRCIKHRNWSNRFPI